MGQGKDSKGGAALTLSFPEVETLVRAHLDRGETKEAVACARAAHKRLGTLASETLAVDAYLARIAALRARGLDAEARALSDSIRKRYPSASARLREGGAQRELALLVAPLADREFAERGALEERIRREVVDLTALAEVDSLDETHPLRRAAGALIPAFEAVTSGAVLEGDLRLAEVSRRSPLAPWKSLIHAIAAYHDGEDDRCARSLRAIPEDSAVAPAATALRALLRGERVSGVTRGGDELRSTLQALDKAFAVGRAKKILRAIRAATTACGREAPELLARLGQLISVRSVRLDMVPEPVREALGGPPRRDSSFWQLYARGLEESGACARAAAAWLELLRVAPLEGRFGADGLEAAAILLRAAELVERAQGHHRTGELAVFLREFSGYEGYYEGQPPEVLAWAPRGPEDRPRLDAAWLLERACALDPHAEAFRSWHALVGRNRFCAPAKRRKEAERVAKAWHAALAEDPEPLLHIVASAEARGALVQAMRFLERAEQLDGLDSGMRRTRFRLLVSNARRHARQKKPHLLAKDVAALAALPDATERRRPALLAALRGVEAELRGEADDEARWQAVVAAELGGGLAAALLLSAVRRACGLRASRPPAGSSEVLLAIARAALVAREAGFAVELAKGLEKPLKAELASEATGEATLAELRALTETLLAGSRRQQPLAFAVAGVGLRRGGLEQARFLLLRAQSLPGFSAARQLELGKAALGLARRLRNTELASEAAELVRETAPWGSSGEDALSFEEAQRVVEREVAARRYPRAPTRRDRALERCDCPACGLGPGGGSGEAFEGPDLDEVWPDESAGLPGLPGSTDAIAALMEFVGPDGSLPDPEQLAREDPELMAMLAAALGLDASDLDLPGLGLPGRRRPGRKKKKRKRRR